MLEYINKHGDENLAVYEFRNQKGSDATLPDDLKLREQHKYYLYSNYDAIVFNETQVPIELEMGADENKVIEIDWSQIDTSGFTIEASSSEPQPA
jgi:hypothetical protein